MQKQIPKFILVAAIFLMLPDFASADVNTIIADPSNVADCGTLNQPNTTYTLRNDVSSVGSCFAVIAGGVTLDLNGFTATYDNGASIVVPNGDFENGSGASVDNWDVSLAPNIQRTAGTYVQPASLYSGNYALKIAVPAADQQVRSVGQVTLEPNTTYSISAMLYNNYQNAGYQSEAVTLFVGLDDGTASKTASGTGINWRGFQYTYKTFSTGPTPESYNVIAGISGAAGAATGSVYIDDIKIQKHYLSGVFVGPASWNPLRYPDVTRYGNAVGTVIKNGQIVQGQGLSDYSDAIYVAENSGTAFDFNHLEITTKGASSHSIFSYNMVGGKINDNLIHHEVSTITSRDGYNGAAIKIEYGGDGGFIQNNVIDKNIQTAIHAPTKGSCTLATPIICDAVSNEISGNTLTLQTKYTNDFAIVASGSIIHDNIVNCGSGNNSCRGIGIGGNRTEAYNNAISVQQLPRNQEYDGCQAAGAYGMQLESNTHNVKVYGNTVTANAGVCEAYAFRANPYAEGGVDSSNNLVHDNTFIAMQNGASRAATIKYSQLDLDDVALENNTFIANYRWIYVDGGGPVVNPTFVGNRWETTGTLPDPFRPFEVYTWASSYFAGTFLDNTYGSPEDKIRFEGEVFRTSNGNPEPNSSFAISVSDMIAPSAPLGLNVL
ncbi:MAG: hypothetical protein HGA36_04080 [Candidatus Moranbacteria bacterium]|nr:hypothetical protein [Candidatus Moranbacteria bacterium]